MQKMHDLTNERAGENHSGVVSNSSWSIELPWPPVTGNRAVRHAGRGVHYKTREAQAYDAAVAAIVVALGVGQGAGRKALGGPLVAEWVLAPPDRRARDLDNLRKVCADALTKAGLWKDDSNKVLLRESFIWTEPVAGGSVFLTLETL